MFKGFFKKGNKAIPNDGNADEISFGYFKKGKKIIPNDETLDAASLGYFKKGEKYIPGLSIREISNVPIAIFNDPEGNKDILKLIIGIEPVQDLHGYDSPWPGGGTKNKMPPASAKTEVINGVTFTSDGNGTYTAKGTASASATCYFEPAESFTILDGPDDARPKLALNNSQVSNGILFQFFNGNTQIDSWGCNPINRFVTYGGMRGKSCNKYAVVVDSGVVADIKIQPMLVENSVTNSSFAPYSNICPISGWSGANVYVEETYDAQAAPKAAISFGQTVYGGTLNVTTGVLTVTHANIASYAGETLPSTWICDRAVYAEGVTPPTGSQVVYELATPQTIQLTPTQVNTLLGMNNVWADCGDVISLVYQGI